MTAAALSAHVEKKRERERELASKKSMTQGSRLITQKRKKRRIASRNYRAAVFFAHNRETLNLLSVAPVKKFSQFFISSEIHARIKNYSILLNLTFKITLFLLTVNLNECMEIIFPGTNYTFGINLLQSKLYRFQSKQI